MTRRTFAYLVAILAAAACQKADPSTAPADQAKKVGSDDPWAAKAVVKHPLPHPFFWSVEKDGKTTYMLGTMHVGIDAESQLPQIVFDKLDAARAFAMETDINDQSLGELNLPAGETVHQELGDDYWHKLEGALTPPVASRIDRMKPMVAATMLSMKDMPKTGAMDSLLLGRATNKRKQIVYLEPAAKQEKLLEKWMDARALKEMIDDLDTSAARQHEMVDAYLAGDDSKATELADEERADAKRHGHTDAEYDQEMDEMLYDRNASWIPELEQLHADGGGFVAVGAMHLLGKRSVLDLLAAKGYKITRISP